MKNNGRKANPSPKPVRKIELSEKYIKPRGILAIFFLIVGIVFIGIGLMAALETETDWQEIEVSNSNPNCSGDFVLMYDFSDAGKNASSMNKTLNNLYTEATQTGYQIFSAYERQEGLGNVAYLNDHVNEIVTVEEPLYQALSQVVASGDRHIFAAPAMERYRLVFSSESDEEAAQFDPATSQETAGYLAELAKFLSDPEQIQLKLYEDCRVELVVSQAYLVFARENEISVFLDFDWMTNAFLADYLAQILIENGFASGYLSSYDGFTRNLDTRSNTYYASVMAVEEGAALNPAVMSYEGALSLVMLRSFPLSDSDQWHYYTYANGETVSSYLDMDSCLSKAGADSLLCYGKDLSCGEILLSTINLYAAENLDVQGLNRLTAQGIGYVWCDGRKVHYKDATLTLLNEDYTLIPEA